MFWISRLLLRGLELAAERAQITAQPRDLALLLRELAPARGDLAGQHLRRASDLLEFLLQLDHPSLEFLAGLLEYDRLSDLGQHQQQDDRAEAAADRVQEGQAERLDVAATEPGLHGQSRAGLRKIPPVRRVSAQYAVGAIGSPSIGSRITFTATPRGSRASALSNSLSR